MCNKINYTKYMMQAGHTLRTKYLLKYMAGNEKLTLEKKGQIREVPQRIWHQSEPWSVSNNSSLVVVQMQNHSGIKHGKCEKLQIVPFRLSQTPINVKGCSIVWNSRRGFGLKSISKNWLHICSTTLIWKKETNNYYVSCIYQEHATYFRCLIT